MGSKSKLLNRISKSATKTKWKGKRWKKGKSSSSNPDTKRFRDAAKTRFFQPMSAGSAGTSGLTVDALAKHDEDHFSKDTDSLQEGFEKLSTSDKLSVGAKTFNTWATNYTECTNVTFNKVHRYWSSNSALHKEVIAILAAVTEVIKTNDGNETETEYFAALTDSVTLTNGDYKTDSVTLTSGDYTTDSVTLTSGDYTTDSVTLTSGDYTTDSVTLTSGDYTTDSVTITSGYHND
ncbi:RRP12 [Mytilus edulis]|uniref:RRP12 n=1 Tax=Mytilus edulis TaxID=6550 RepID=A0A8S3UVS5_MYTED|nr:RRP12 [Mytilus edulis]